MNRMNDEWYGVTYPVPRFLQVNWFYDLWKRFMCPHGWHLLDECQSVDDHYLVCDACDFEIPLADKEAKP